MGRPSLPNNPWNFTKDALALDLELGQTAIAFRSVVGTNIGIGSQGFLMDGTPQQKAT